MKKLLLSFFAILSLFAGCKKSGNNPSSIGKSYYLSSLIQTDSLGRPYFTTNYYWDNNMRLDSCSDGYSYSYNGNKISHVKHYSKSGLLGENDIYQYYDTSLIIVIYEKNQNGKMTKNRYYNVHFNSNGQWLSSDQYNYNTDTVNAEIYNKTLFSYDALGNLINTISYYPKGMNGSSCQDSSNTVITYDSKKCFYSHWPVGQYTAMFGANNVLSETMSENDCAKGIIKDSYNYSYTYNVDGYPTSGYIKSDKINLAMTYIVK